MEYLYSSIILIIGLALGFFGSYLLFIIKKEKVSIVEEREKFKEEIINYKNFEAEKKNIIEDKQNEVNQSYNKGFEEGYKRAEMNSKIISLQIKDWEGTEIRKEFFRKTIIKKIGYQYQLFVNGIPCLSPHEIVEKEINLNEANEENIKFVIEKVKDSVDNAIKNIGGLATFIGDFDSLKDSIIKQLPKRKS